MSALATTGSILGMVLGTAGVTISVLNYLRDRPQVKVTLQWNMVDPNTGEVRGLVRITNTGRRAVYICIAALEGIRQSKHICSLRLGCDGLMA